jgi:ABC-type amino acid transport substrate-binding protein
MNAQTIEECVTAVAEDRVRGFVYDASILEYFATQYPGQFAVCRRNEAY